MISKKKTLKFGERAFIEHMAVKIQQILLSDNNKAFNQFQYLINHKKK